MLGVFLKACCLGQEDEGDLVVLHTALQLLPKDACNLHAAGVWKW